MNTFSEQVIYGKNSVVEALKGSRPIDSILLSCKDSDPFAHKVRALAKEKNTVVKMVSSKRLDELSDGGVHQGAVAIIGEFEYREFEDMLDSAKKSDGRVFFVILDEIEDPHNLGAVIRTAECAGANGVIIGKHRSASVTSTVVKVSAGACEYIPISRVTNIADTIDRLKSEGVFVYGADMSGENFRTANLSGNIALVVGNEGKGLSRLVKQKCDALISVAQRGQISSLNVSVAAGILLYQIESFDN